MKTATIVMPLVLVPTGYFPGVAKGEAHHYIERTMLDRFGGYSEYDGSGAWKDDTGRVHTEPHIKYVIAFEMDSGAWEYIKAVAINAAQMQGEQAVYVEMGGWAEIINTGE